MLKMLTEVVIHIVSNALVQQTLFRFIDVMHPRLEESLPADAMNLVVDRSKAKAVRWPQIRLNESGC